MNTTIRLIGSTTQHTAYALINREWKALLEQAGCQVIVDGSEHSDITIHHDYATRFTDLSRPDTNRFIAVRTWDFGPYPPTWVAVIKQHVDHLWVYSSWTREQAVKSGIPSERVHVMPHFIDTGVFQPDGLQLPLPTDKTFRFLFVGAAVIRKGVDILLKAYTQAFTSSDDVALIIKDHTADAFYQGQSLKAHISQLQDDLDNPEIVYMDDYLPADQLAALYRSCDVGVFPYRAEGLGIPILEAMACGLPCLVPDFGACRDFCDDMNAYLLPTRRIWLPVTREFAYNSLGYEVEIREVDFAEVSIDALADTMRHIVDTSSEERAQKGRLARQRVAEQFSAGPISARLITLVGLIG